MPRSIAHSGQPATSSAVTKYLFLDFDGPLHPSTTLQGKNVGLLASSPSALRSAGFFIWSDLLEDILCRAEASNPALQISIIVHSSWRAQTWFSTPVIRQALGSLGQRICGFTRTELGRAEAVAELCERMGITDYLILDDDVKSFAGREPVCSRLLAVSPLSGVRDSQVQDALLEWATVATPRPTGEPTPTAV